jgi:hypothetical protein
MTERITCSAIWYKDLELDRDVRNPTNITQGVVVLGHRHGDIIRNLHNLLGLRSVERGENSVGENEQGFLTNTDRFVDRKEAMIIARNAKQLINEDWNKEYLYSEDLY